jgi:hypothetical protein
VWDNAETLNIERANLAVGTALTVSVSEKSRAEQALFIFLTWWTKML